MTTDSEIPKIVIGRTTDLFGELKNLEVSRKVWEDGCDLSDVSGSVEE